jgi:hypothetical protein
VRVGDTGIKRKKDKEKRVKDEGKKEITSR